MVPGLQKFSEGRWIMGHKRIAFTDHGHTKSLNNLSGIEQLQGLQTKSLPALFAVSVLALPAKVPSGQNSKSAAESILHMARHGAYALANYQANWFLVLCAVVIFAVLWAAYQLRLGRLHRDFDVRLEARVAERTRIARDLHDTLLQSLHGLLLRLQVISQLLPESEAKTKLDSTIQQVSDAIAESRDAVQGLRTSIVEYNDLAQAVNALGEELATTSKNDRSAVFVLIVEGKPRDLHPVVRDDIYRISAEALRNAFRHGQADRVEVEIRYDNEQFRLRVRDDGRGIDPAALSGQNGIGHYGLHGMRERAALIRAKLVVWSEVGAGTEVELRVPSDIAFTAIRKYPRLIRNAPGMARA